MQEVAEEQKQTANAGVVQIAIGTPAHAWISALVFLSWLRSQSVEQPSMQMFDDGSGGLYIPATPSNQRLAPFDYAQIISLLGGDASDAEQPLAWESSTDAFNVPVAVLRFTYHFRNFKAGWKLVGTFLTTKGDARGNA